MFFLYTTPNYQLQIDYIKGQNTFSITDYVLTNMIGTVVAYIS